MKDGPVFFVGRGGVYKLQGSANVVRGYCRDIRFKYRANSDVVNENPDATCPVVTTVFEGVVGVCFFFFVFYRLQPGVGLGLFNNSTPLLSILSLHPSTNNLHPL
jgi:hypothetical protein